MQALLACRAPFTPFGARARRHGGGRQRKPRSAVEGVFAQTHHIAIEPNLEAHLPEGKIKHELWLTSPDYFGSGIRSGSCRRSSNWPTISEKAQPQILGHPWHALHVAQLLAGAASEQQAAQDHRAGGGAADEQEARHLPVLLPPKDKLSVMTDHPKFSEAIRAEDDFRAALIRVMKRPGGAPQPLTENVEARKYLRASCLPIEAGGIDD